MLCLCAVRLHVTFRVGSDLLEVWFRVSSVLVQIWVRFGSGLVQVSFRFGSGLVQVWFMSCGRLGRRGPSGLEGMLDKHGFHIYGK